MRAIAALAAAALLLAACGSDSGEGGSSSGGGSIATADKAGKTVLVDSSGMTLYALAGEKGGRFTCTDSKCLATWKPVTGEASGVDGLGTVERPDGGQQVTYRDEPLYTFAGDRTKDDVKGDGVEGWHAVTADKDDSSGGGGGGGGPGGY